MLFPIPWFSGLSARHEESCKKHTNTSLNKDDLWTWCISHMCCQMAFLSVGKAKEVWIIDIKWNPLKSIYTVKSYYYRAHDDYPLQLPLREWNETPPPLMPKQDLRATYLRSNLIISCNLHYISKILQTYAYGEFRSICWVHQPTMSLKSSVNSVFIHFLMNQSKWRHLTCPKMNVDKTQQYLCMNKARGWRANHRIASSIHDTNMKLQPRYIDPNFCAATKTCVPKKCWKEFVVIQQSGTNTRYSDKLCRSCYLVGVAFKYFQAMLLKEPKMIFSFRNKPVKFGDKLNII